MKNILKSNSTGHLITQHQSEAGPEGQALNTAVFLDKHSRAWGGFGADRSASSSLPRPPGEANWINSSLRGSCSLRGHKGNVGWRGKMEGLYLTLIGPLPVCILDCCSINTALCAAWLKWYCQSFPFPYNPITKQCHWFCYRIYLNMQLV